MGENRTHQVRGLIAGLLLLLMPLVGGCRSGNTVALSTADFPKGTGFVQHTLVVAGQSHDLWMFVPKTYKPGVKTPAVLFLHGLFEAGTDGKQCLTAGLGPVVAERRDTWPFITIFPQSTGTWQGEDRDRLAIAALDFAQRKYTVDQDRVILAGLSYGGLGTWEIGARHPERFAALVPVSGFSAADQARKLATLPVWAFSYSGDIFVSSSCSQDMCAAINSRGGRAKFTEFVGIGHDGWDRAVADSDVVNWMLEQRRRSFAPANAPGSGTTVAGVQ
jgi:predicted peptidase